jgi:hypothetical protein
MPDSKIETEPEPEPEHEHVLDNLVCDDCFEKNLTENVHIQSCVVCESSYCRHHASVIDPIHCAECLNDVSVTVETIQKTQLRENQETKATYVYSRKARQIKIGGLHWLFAQRKIASLSDIELGLAIEYHRAIYDSLIFERERRRQEHFHRNAGIRTPLSPTSPLNNTGTIVTNTTTVKKSRTTSIKKPDAVKTNALSAIDVLLKSGMTLEQIKAIALGKKI